MTFQLIQTKFKKTVLVLGSNSFVAKNIISKIPFRKIVCVQLKKDNILIKKNLKYFFFDLLDLRKLEKIINLYKFQTVIICASNNNNSINSNNNNTNIFQQNTNILLNVLESLKFKKKIEIINFTSTEVLKKNKSIYSIAKTTNDELCKFYKTNYNLKINNLLVTNLFGEGDLNFNRIIPMLIKNIFFKRQIVLKNYSKKLKFMFVDNLIKIVLNPKKKLNYYYFISINQLITKIRYLIKFNKNKKNNNFNSEFDHQLYQTISWYRKYFNKKL